jgi:hypothetical protein
MWIRQSVRSVSSALAALVLVLSGASLAEGSFGADSSAGAASPRLLQIDPGVVEFPDTTLGTQTETSTILKNEGSSTDVVDLLSGSVTFSGTGADDYQVIAGGCPHPQQAGGDPPAVIILMPGQTCGLEIYFTPGGLGDRSATMMIQGSADASGLAVTVQGSGSIGYYEVDQKGTVAHIGDAAYYGDASGGPLNQPIVAMAQTGDNGGYWLVGSDGGIFNYGDANFYGSAGGIHLNQPIVGMASAHFGVGYWLVASDGGIFAYGDAGFYGSAGSIHLNKPVVGMAANPAGGGYWLVASDGGIFAYGDAGFYGSTGSIHLNKSVVGMAATPDGRGYWLVASDGGIFAYGDAQFYGSTASNPLNQPIVAMASMPDGGGYWFTASDGGVFNFGDAPFLGSGTNLGLSQVMDMATNSSPLGVGGEPPEA